MCTLIAGPESPGYLTYVPICDTWYFDSILNLLNFSHSVRYSVGLYWNFHLHFPAN